MKQDRRVTLRFATGGLVAFVLGLCAVWPATSHAGGPSVIRFAEPVGDGAEPCAQADPCEIFRAVESAPSGAQVMLAPGTYSLGAEQVLDVPIGVAVHATGDATNTTLTSSAQVGVSMLGQGTLTDVTILGVNSRSLIVFGDSTARRVYVQNSTSADSAYACVGYYAALITDSVCNATGQLGSAVVNLAEGGTSALTLRNVTAVASNGGRGIWAVAAPGDAVITARNTIAIGAPDVRADAGVGSVASIDLDFSNFSGFEAGGGGFTSVTPPGSLENQSAEPIFVDAANGNFREAPNSPTIDAGSTAVVAPTDTDLDGNARMFGNAPDIGAYESLFVDTTPPSVEITKGPKKRTAKRKATFKFEGADNVTDPGDLVIECALDENSDEKFKPCTSPQTYKRLKPGRHQFFVRATDEADNMSEPVKYGWKVLKD